MKRRRLMRSTDLARLIRSTPSNHQGAMSHCNQLEEQASRASIDGVADPSSKHLHIAKDLQAIHRSARRQNSHRCHRRFDRRVGDMACPEWQKEIARHKARAHRFGQPKSVACACQSNRTSHRTSPASRWNSCQSSQSRLLCSS